MKKETKRIPNIIISVVAVAIFLGGLILMVNY